jgi:hypothetical protein
LVIGGGRGNELWMRRCQLLLLDKVVDSEDTHEEESKVIVSQRGPREHELNSIIDEFNLGLGK